MDSAQSKSTNKTGKPRRKTVKRIRPKSKSKGSKTSSEGSSKSRKRILKKKVVKPVIQQELIDSTNNVLDRCNQPIIFDQSFSKRVDLNNWILPNNKHFPNFINDFTQKVMELPRTPLKVWKNSEYVDIRPFKHQQFVADFLSDNRYCIKE